MQDRFKLPVKERYKPISGYGIIGNTRTAALVGYDGSIDWCCFPRFDSPPVFAALLDSKKGGNWSIQPVEAGSSTQRYLEDTNILRTEFEAAGSRVTLTDFMPCSVSNEAWSTPPEVHRIVEGINGKMGLRFVFKPTFDYGRVKPSTERTEHGLAMRDEKYEMVLSWSAALPHSEDGVEGTFQVSQGEKQTFVLSYGESEPRLIREYHTERQRAKTELFWLDWVAQLKYRGKWRNAVIRSALALKLLVYSPTGAIVAAATTSLPEAVGGDRNWDYRYSWLRDSASALWAFHLLGYRSESEAYLHWLIDNNPVLDLDLRLMYAVDGGADLNEVNLKNLEGYRRSRPVRIGNAASAQLQLDAYGYMLDSLYFSSKHGRAVSDEMYYRFAKPLARFIVENWDKRGNGIWEIRRMREHFVYTKAWSYCGLDRAVRIAKATGHFEDVKEWNQVKKRIKTEVLRRGWSRKKRSFVMHYGSDRLDAANLMLPLIGFISVESEKMVSTIEATQKELADGALVYRYNGPDGLKGKEGAFLLCGFWLVGCLARLGKKEEALKNFEELVGHSNHLGLFSEEVDPKTGEALGNFPQAFSHMGLIMAAHELSSFAEGGQQ